MSESTSGHRQRRLSLLTAASSRNTSATSTMESKGTRPPASPSAVRITPDRQGLFRRGGGGVGQEVRSSARSRCASGAHHQLTESARIVRTPLVEHEAEQCPFCNQTQESCVSGSGRRGCFLVPRVRHQRGRDAGQQDISPMLLQSLTYQTAAPLSSLERTYYESMHFKLAIQVAAQDSLIDRAGDEDRRSSAICYSHKSQERSDTNPANSVTFVIPETTAGCRSLSRSSASDGSICSGRCGSLARRTLSFFRYYGGNRVISYYSSGVSEKSEAIPSTSAS